MALNSWALRLDASGRETGFIGPPTGATPIAHCGENPPEIAGIGPDLLGEPGPAAHARGWNYSMTELNFRVTCEEKVSPTGDAVSHNRASSAS